MSRLLDHWEERKKTLGTIIDVYKPRKKSDFLTYGKMCGEIDTIDQAFRVLNYDV